MLCFNSVIPQLSQRGPLKGIFCSSNNCAYILSDSVEYFCVVGVLSQVACILITEFVLISFSTDFNIQATKKERD